jgi:hypothetical protein
MLDQFGIGTQKTRDEIGDEPSTIEIYPINNEVVNVIGVTNRVQNQTIGNSFIVGSITNGIIGSNINTQNGVLEVLGEAGRSATTVSIISTNNVFVENFRTTTYKYVAVGATWSTASGLLTIGSHGLTISNPFYLGKTVTKVKFTADFESGTAGILIGREVSATYSATQLENGVETVLDYPLTTMVWKLSTETGYLCTATKIRIEYQ